MANKSSYESLLNAAAKLSQQAATDKTIAERLLNDPGNAISEAAGQPLPKGVKITVEYGADGKSFRLKPEMGPDIPASSTTRFWTRLRAARVSGGTWSATAPSPAAIRAA